MRRILRIITEITERLFDERFERGPQIMRIRWIFADDWGPLNALIGWIFADLLNGGRLMVAKGSMMAWRQQKRIYRQGWNQI